jgi:hypothetical protein
MCLEEFLMTERWCYSVDAVGFLPTVVAPLAALTAGIALLRFGGAGGAAFLLVLGGLLGLIGFNAHRVLAGEAGGFSMFANGANVFAHYFSSMLVALGVLWLVLTRSFSPRSEE